MGQVRNCVATFVFDTDVVSNVSVQCSQETADILDQQIGDIRAVADARFEPDTDGRAERRLAACPACNAVRLPVSPLREIDVDGEIAAYFDRSLATNASTSLGAVYLDGRLYRHPPRTRHGPYPYPDEMRHGVYSVTKSMAGALALFHFAERYGDDVFDELITDHVPALADTRAWEGVTFANALNMATGTRGGEKPELLFEPLVSAPDADTAIGNIARLGDHPPAPGEAFEYATTNTFVLSRALENYVRAREGPDVHYWDLVHDDVLVPIGADDFRVLHTRDPQVSDRIPLLGYGAVPSLDTAAKISALIANEGQHEGRQLLDRDRIREALGRTDWPGYPIDETTRYRHSFWSTDVQTDRCTVPVTYMQGHGGNHVVFLPSGAIVVRFMDEQDMDVAPLVRAVERVRSSCTTDPG
jgi:CubicO group peptidase (beta-lactamase class C family)